MLTSGSEDIWTTGNFARNAKNPGKRRRRKKKKPNRLFVNELLQSLGNSHANEREYRNQQRKIDNR